jgi:hypothetical protein
MSPAFVPVTGLVADGRQLSDGAKGAPSLVAVEFTIKDVGSAAEQEHPYNDAVVIDNEGHTSDSDAGFNVTQCQSWGYSATINIGPGESATGCNVFDMAPGAKVAKVQFTPKTGTDTSFGEWLVS